MSYNSWEGKKPKRGKFVNEGGNKFEISSDLRWKQLVYRWDVPEKVLADQFDYLGEDVDDGFFQYRNYWYHLGDFPRTSGELKALGWDGYSSDSYFSGVVIALTNDGEEYIVGTYMS